MRRKFIGRPSFRSFGRYVDRVRAVNMRLHPQRGGFAL